jgi:hypothetical protein
VSGGSDCQAKAKAKAQDSGINLNLKLKNGDKQGGIQCNKLGIGIGKHTDIDIDMCNQVDPKKSDNSLNPYKAIVDINKGGYNSYKNKALLGDIKDILNDDLRNVIEANFQENVLKLLDADKCYSVLLQLTYISNGQMKGASPMKSIIITKNININLVIQRIKSALLHFECEYQLSDYYGKCFVC